MIQSHPIRRIVVVSVSLGLAAATVTFAQQPAPKKQAAAVDQAPASDKPSEATAKEILLASPIWKEMYSEFQKWLASQAIYTPADVKRINANLAAQLRSMPVSELEGFLNDWQAKLDVLDGRDFQEAQQWLGQYLSVFADGFRRQTLENLGLSDITKMSAREFENAVLNARADRLAAQQRRQEFNQFNQNTQTQMIQNARQNNAANRDARQQARAGGARFGTNQSPYRPQLFDPPAPPRRQLILDGAGRILFVLPN
jgi:hypothetical protein